MGQVVILLFSVLVGSTTASLIHSSDHNELERSGKQAGSLSVKGGVDFSGCVVEPDSDLCCIEKIESVTSIKKEPVLECTHKNTEQCHYTYVTQFKPAVQEVCEENFEKKCSITFKQQAFNETVQHCYRPVEKVCNGQGPRECRTVYESSCSTKYVEKTPGKFVGDTSCEKLPIRICGRGCQFEQGVESCHDKVVSSLVDIPEEVCDLNPQKTCRHETKLVPSLRPQQQCTIVPKETCHLKHKSPQVVRSPLLTRWCLDPTPVEESNVRAEPLEPETLETFIDQKSEPVEPPTSYFGPVTAETVPTISLDIFTASKPEPVLAPVPPPSSYLGPQEASSVLDPVQAAEPFTGYIAFQQPSTNVRTVLPPPRAISPPAGYGNSARL